MDLSPTQIRWLGTATWWPLLYVLLFFGFMVLWMLGIGLLGFGLVGEGAAVGVAGLMMAGFSALLVLHIATMLLMLGLLGLYLAHVVKTPDIDSNTRLMWAMVMLLAGPVGQLLYYYRVVRVDGAAPTG
ncbi:MAG: hypothetical protein JXX28_02410 [Deltaproteobacteria bacterium]|nr:hypothetical protein [Deltaproteobacteria bacterium]